MGTVILTVSLIFLLSLIISVILYLIGSIVSPKGKDRIGNKLATYACGEAWTPRKLQLSTENFFLYITFFLVFDISAFLMALSYNSQGFYPIFFGIFVLLSVITLIPIWRK